MKDAIKNFIFRRKYAYVQTFMGPLGQEVLRDLMQFCRAHESTFHENPHLADMLAGRREVWLRIQNHLKLSDEDLYAISTGTAVKKQVVDSEE